ncbi:MAG: hypothetical protein H6686_04910 [Fibrobacteria bacterium]|nr:hypothetical protein [Fibrobacteria bacterium]
MPRLVQSTLVQGSPESWLELLRDESCIIPLASSAPTLSLRLLFGHDNLWARHDLVHGFFRTSWTSRVERLDPTDGVLVTQLNAALFASFRHEMRWESSGEGLVVRSDIMWEGGRPSLESLLSQAILRFPLSETEAPRLADSPTRRMTLDTRSFGAA